jgi:ATP adenylyltransferase
MNESTRGGLWQQVRHRTEQALNSGALQPIPTEYEFVEDGGVEFLVRVVSNLARKDRARKEANNQRAQNASPFIDYDPALHVVDLPPSHVCMLNKYNVVDHHVLIVTRDFEHQEELLNERDFAALWRCMVQGDALGFYNGGTMGGASQPHKHLQLIPLPLAPHGPAVPVGPLIDLDAPDEGVGRSESLPFAHALARLPADVTSNPSDAARVTLTLYKRMRTAAGVSDTPGRPGPYNLLVTRQWMLLVPRTREHFGQISLNALAFAGALLVHDQQQMEFLKCKGPMQALIHATT